MAILLINITEKGRKRLCDVLLSLHWMCAMCGLSIIVVGLYLKTRIAAKVNLVEGYNGNTLPLMLIFLGACSAIIDLAGGKLCNSIGDVSRRRTLKRLLLPYLLLLVVLNVCIFIAACACFAHRRHLHTSFTEGLGKAMDSYKTNGTAKSEFDSLQIEFECCGNSGYEDWFDLQWIPDAYLDKANKKIQSKISDGKFLNDDVPYSCCNSNSARPCIHHHVHDNDQHFRYDYRTGLTLHTRGCKTALMDYFNVRLNRIGLTIMLIFLNQTVIFLLLRYLQTSVSNAFDMGDPEETAPGWLLDKIPFTDAKSSKPKKKKKVDKEDDDVEDQDTESDGSDDEESFGIEYSPQGQDWNEEVRPSNRNEPRGGGGGRRNEDEEPVYQNLPRGGGQGLGELDLGELDFGGFDLDDLGGEMGDLPDFGHKKDKGSKSDKNSKSDKTTKSDKNSKTDKNSKSGKDSKSNKNSKSDKSSKSGTNSKSAKDSKSDKGSTKKASESTKKSPGSTKKSPGSTNKSPGSTKKSPGSTKKSPGSTKKSAGSTQKSPASTKKSPASTKKSPGSTKKSPGSTRKSAGSTQKSSGSTKKSPGSTKKSQGSTKKSPGSAKKSPGSTKKSPGAKKKSPGAKKKSPGAKKKSPGAKKKSPGAKKKSPGAKKKSPGSKGKKGGKMKNKNNNIEDDYWSDSSSSDDSDCSLTPLLSHSNYQQNEVMCESKLASVHRWSRAFRTPAVSTYIDVED